MTEQLLASIPSLTPRDASGHQFVLYADATSGEPGGVHEARHAQVIEIVRRFRPEPEFISFPGDAVMHGNVRAEWEHWLGVEMAWLQGAPYPLYQSTSNHNTGHNASLALYRTFWPDTPDNGPVGAEGLAYFLRRGNLLYVSMHQPEPYTAEDVARVPHQNEWLDQVLTEQADAEYKIVAGHYPVHPVNGYLQAPLWCFPAQAREPFWAVLRKHQVVAYLCSHVIAFDCQIHDGIPQITSGGAGTDYLMPSSTEYLHAAQISIDRLGLRYQAVDTAAATREYGAWPIPGLSLDDWHSRSTTGSVVPAPEAADGLLIVSLAETGAVWERITAGLEPKPFTPEVRWLASDDGRFVLGADVATGRFFVDLELEDHGRQRWYGLHHGFDKAVGIGIYVAFHPGLGPGGVLARLHTEATWTSMQSSSAAGLEAFTWPEALNLQHQCLSLRYVVERV